MAQSDTLILPLSAGSNRGNTKMEAKIQHENRNSFRGESKGSIRVHRLLQDL